MITTQIQPRTMSIGRHRLRVMIRNQGAGRPLLLVNGIGATGELFETLSQYLPEREAISFDAPGVGGSSTPRWPLSMRHLAHVVSELITQLGHDEVDVLGISWGGALVQELGFRHPEKVRRLVLTATMAGIMSVPGRPAALAILMSPARYYSQDYLRQIAPTLYGGAIADHPELLDEHARRRSNRPPSELGYLYQLGAIQGWTSLPWLHRLRPRTLVLAGDDDPIIPLVNGRLLAKLIPDARLHVVEGGGHLFLFVRAEEMASILQTFLDAD